MRAKPSLCVGADSGLNAISDSNSVSNPDLNVKSNPDLSVESGLNTISVSESKSIQALSDRELFVATKNAVAAECAATTNVVRHFAEMYLRRNHASRGHSSMFKMAVEEFGYDGASAQRRVNAMLLSLDVPEVLDLIDSKKMHMQTAADIQTFLNKERGARRPYSVEEKVNLVQQCISLSTRDVQRHLAKLNPQMDFKESKTFISEDRLKITYTVAVEVENKFNRLKELLAHVNPYMSREELFDYIAEIALEKLDPIRKAKRAAKRAAAADLENADSEKSVPAQEPATSLRFREERVGEFGEVQLVAEFHEPTRDHRKFQNTLHSPTVAYEADSEALVFRLKRARWNLTSCAGTKPKLPAQALSRHILRRKRRVPGRMRKSQLESHAHKS